jgi:hypothetical protein
VGAGEGVQRRVADRRFGENARLPAYTLNDNAGRHAKRLIDARRYVLRSRWQSVQPRARDQNAFLKAHSWEHRMTQLEHAEWLAGQGRVEAAEPLLAEARETFERLAARPWLERVDEASRGARDPEAVARPS